MKFYHISYSTEDIIEEFIPRIPEDRMKDENDTIKRVCVAPSLSNCLSAVTWQDEIEYLCDEELPVRVYEFEITDEKIIDSNYLYKSGLVNDANITKEHWILEKIKPSKVYDIVIEEYQEELSALIPYSELNNEDYMYNNGKEYKLLKYRIETI